MFLSHSVFIFIIVGLLESISDYFKVWIVQIGSDSFNFFGVIWKACNAIKLFQSPKGAFKGPFDGWSSLLKFRIQIEILSNKEYIEYSQRSLNILDQGRPF